MPLGQHRRALPAAAAATRPVQHYYDLGLIPKLLPRLERPILHVKNHQRELTLPRLTAAPTATTLAYM